MSVCNIFIWLRYMALHLFLLPCSWEGEVCCPLWNPCSNCVSTSPIMPQCSQSALSGPITFKRTMRISSCYRRSCSVLWTSMRECTTSASRDISRRSICKEGSYSYFVKYQPLVYCSACFISKYAQPLFVCNIEKVRYESSRTHL